jgi:serine/threonine-protein kinase
VVKLVDFGLVKLLQPDESRTVTVVQGRGTVAYTPLEQYGGDTGHTDARSDIFSLGATVYHLLTGQPPADAKQRFLKPGSLIPPRDINPRISPQTEKAVLAAMAQHPDDRPASALVFRELLLNQQPAPAAGPILRRPLHLPADADRWVELLRPHRWQLAAFAALMALALIVTIWSPSLPR